MSIQISVPTRQSKSRTPLIIKIPPGGKYFRVKANLPEGAFLTNSKKYQIFQADTDSNKYCVAHVKPDYETDSDYALNIMLATGHGDIDNAQTAAELFENLENEKIEHLKLPTKEWRDILNDDLILLA